VGGLLPRRAPSSSEIERSRAGARPSTTPTQRRPLSPISNKARGIAGTTGRPMSPSSGPATRPVSPKLITPPQPELITKGPRKDVASKIASLWKKVEDSKKQKKDTAKDKRVWISKGKVQQQTQKNEQQDMNSTAGRLIRSGTYEKLTDPSIQDSKFSETATVDGKPTGTTTENKQSTRSRLSIKLSSRFGLKKQQPQQKGGVNGGVSAVEPTAEDNMNGNTTTPTADDLGNSVELVTTPDNDDESSTSSPRYDYPPSNDDGQLSPAPSSPRGDESSDTLMGPPPLPTMAYANNKLIKQTTTHLKRNSSYVSSLGRKLDEESQFDGQTLSSVEELTTQQQQKKSFSKTSSSVVTLV
jgi:hypothetical protein